VRQPARIPRPRRLARVVRVLRAVLVPSPICAMAFIPAMGGHDIHWLPSALPPKIAEQAQHEREEHAHARIVIVLTLACTLLAIYDLFLLASRG